MSKIDKSSLPRLNINDIHLPFSTTVKNLGVILNHHLTWAEQVNSVSRRAFGALHSLYRLKNFLPERIKIKLVQSLVFPIVDYCDIAFLDVNHEQAKRLQRIQNACIRFVFDLKYSEHLTSYFAKVEWLKLSDNRNFYKLILLYKILQIKDPQYLYNRFQHLSDFHSRNTRSRERSLLSIPAHKLNFYANSFTVTSAGLWNKLPPEIHVSSSIVTFKKLLKLHILYNEN